MAVPCTVGYDTILSMLGTFFSAFVIHQATQLRLAGQQGLVTPQKKLFIVTSDVRLEGEDEGARS
jgi:hypothetical protein